jgi:magnesium-protoporphyrin O-methyltransferase
MNCCQCSGIESQFDRREAAHDLARYRRRGPARTTSMLVDALVAAGVAGRTLLDIGGGVGAIQHALLAAGASGATDVDAASAYLDTAREEAQRRGLAGRVRYVHGDFVALADTIEPADIVTLDRVLCCYHDMPALVGASAARARQLYGLVYPRDGWLIAAGVRAINLVYRLQRTPFRIFQHPTAAVDALVRRQGLERIFSRYAGLWLVVVYQKTYP